jgi:hypothetical protein
MERAPMSATDSTHRVGTLTASCADLVEAFGPPHDRGEWQFFTGGPKESARIFKSGGPVMEMREPVVTIYCLGGRVICPTSRTFRKKVEWSVGGYSARALEALRAAGFNVMTNQEAEAARRNVPAVEVR